MVNMESGSILPVEIRISDVGPLEWNSTVILAAVRDDRHGVNAPDEVVRVAVAPDEQ